MRHRFAPLGGTLNTFRCSRCGVPLNVTTEKLNCLSRSGIARALGHIHRTLGLTRRQAYDEIYGRGAA